MDETTPGRPGIDESQIEQTVRKEAEAAGRMSSERAQRFYDRVRGNIQRYLAKRGRIVEKGADFLLLVPDVFILLWRLANDPRVSGKNKVLLGSAIAYFVFPLDFMPEAFFGPIGFLDDLVFAAYALNKILADTDPNVLREHWAGDTDVLESMQRVLNAADNLVGSELLNKIKRMVK